MTTTWDEKLERLHADQGYLVMGSVTPCEIGKPMPGYWSGLTRLEIPGAANTEWLVIASTTAQEFADQGRKVGDVDPDNVPAGYFFYRIKARD